MRTFEVRWELLMTKFDIKKELRKIQIFNEMEGYSNFADFVPFKTVSFDSIPGAFSGSTEDRLLILLDQYDKHMQDYKNVSQTLYHLNSDDRYLFYQIFVFHEPIKTLRKRKNNPFVYEDTLIEFLSVNDSYLWKDSILSSYKNMKEEYINNLKNLKKDIFDNDNLEKKYDYCECLKSLNKCGYKDVKKSLCFFRVAYDEGLIQINDLERFLPLIKGGNKVLKQIREGGCHT